MLNTLPVKAAVRQPRAIVRVSTPYLSADDALAASLSSGGTSASSPVAIDACIHWSVSNNSYFEADTFSVDFAVSKLPASNDADWFSQQSEIFLEVLAGFPANPAASTASELTSLIYGRVDTIDFDPTGTTMTLTGRDLTAVFIDNKLTQTYQEQKAFRAVEALAQSHGLSCLATVTTGKIGSYLLNQQVRIQATQSEWDFIAWLARESGFVAYVQGQSLYFGPDERVGAEPYAIQWTPPTSTQNTPAANVTSLRFSRGMTVAKGITVTCRSTQHGKKTAVVQSYPSAAKTVQAGKSGPFGNVQTYYYNIAPNLTPQQVESAAEQRYNQIVSHAMKLSAELPADLLMSISVPIQVTGTGTAWDQTYYPRLITRSMSVDEGFAMSVEAQNTTPELERAVG
jgi:phage protein D